PVRQFSKLLVSATHPPHLLFFLLDAYGWIWFRQPFNQPLAYISKFYYKERLIFVRANVKIVFPFAKSFSPNASISLKKSPACLFKAKQAGDFNTYLL
ncbi:MAG: hypothetical protein ACOC11_03445, partial [Prolixibacteraceae bacterium]